MDLISKQNTIEASTESNLKSHMDSVADELENCVDDEFIRLGEAIDDEILNSYFRIRSIIMSRSSAEPEIIRCKDCRFDRACTHTMMRKPRGGGIIYCSVEYCSEAERKDNGDFDMMRGESND